MNATETTDQEQCEIVGSEFLASDGNICTHRDLAEALKLASKTEIDIGPCQEEILAAEAWYCVQLMQNS